MLRCMLKNADADAADRNRAAGEPQLNQLIEVISTPDAGLLSAIVHGGLDAATHLAADVIAERYLLRLTHLADASPEQIIGLLRPCFQSLTNRPDGSSPPLWTTPEDCRTRLLDSAPPSERVGPVAYG